MDESDRQQVRAYVEAIAGPEGPVDAAFERAVRSRARLPQEAQERAAKLHEVAQDAVNAEVE